MKTREQTILAMGRDIERELTQARAIIKNQEDIIEDWSTIARYLLGDKADEFGKHQRDIIQGAIARRSGDPDCKLGLDA